MKYVLVSVLSILSFTAITLLLPNAYEKYCNPKEVISKEKYANHYFYKMNDGNYVWSEKDVAVGEIVCQPKR